MQVSEASLRPGQDYRRQETLLSVSITLTDVTDVFQPNHRLHMEMAVDDGPFSLLCYPLRPPKHCIGEKTCHLNGLRLKGGSDDLWEVVAKSRESVMIRVEISDSDVAPVLANLSTRYVRRAFRERRQRPKNKRIKRRQQHDHYDRPAKVQQRSIRELLQEVTGLQVDDQDQSKIKEYSAEEWAAWNVQQQQQPQQWQQQQPQQWQQQPQQCQQQPQQWQQQPQQQTQQQWQQPWQPQEQQQPQEPQEPQWQQEPKWHQKQQWSEATIAPPCPPPIQPPCPPPIQQSTLLSLLQTLQQ
jgi:hypothetical protein